MRSIACPQRRSATIFPCRCAPFLAKQNSRRPPLSAVLHRGHPDPSVNSSGIAIDVRWISGLRSLPVFLHPGPDPLRFRVQGGENAARMRESTSLLAASLPGDHPTRLTDEPACVEGEKTVGLPQQEAEEVAVVLNTLSLGMARGPNLTSLYRGCCIYAVDGLFTA